MVVVVDRDWRGEIMNRLEQVGRYHASRTILCTVESRRTTIDASVVVMVEGDAGPDEPHLARERVIVELGERHLPKLDTIVDPLVVTDLPTVAWAPHGHPEALDALLHIVAGGADRLRERARPGGRAAAREGARRGRLRRGPRVAAHDAVARARGVDVRPAALARRAGRRSTR